MVNLSFVFTATTAWKGIHKFLVISKEKRTWFQRDISKELNCIWMALMFYELTIIWILTEADFSLLSSTLVPDCGNWCYICRVSANLKNVSNIDHVLLVCIWITTYEFWDCMDGENWSSGIIQWMLAYMSIS